MIGCKRCGECCRWYVSYLSGYDYDVEFVEGMEGKVVGEFALIPSPCKFQIGNDCKLYPNHFRYCKNFPKSDEGWVRALGCKYFEE